MGLFCTDAAGMVSKVTVIAFTLSRELLEGILGKSLHYVTK